MTDTISSNRYHRISGWPEKPVDPYFCHTADLNMCFAHVCDDSRVQITIILEDAPLANSFRPLQLCDVCGCCRNCLRMSECKMLCIKAFTVEILCCCAHAADIPVGNFSIGKGHCLMHLHGGWKRRQIIRHSLNCSVDVLFIHKKT